MRRLRGLLKATGGEAAELGEDDVTMVDGEVSLVRAVGAAVQSLDPDILLAWDINRASFGFLIERANVLGIEPPLLRTLGRTPGVEGRNERAGHDEWGARTNSHIHVVGRLFLCGWRLAVGELKLMDYTLPAVAAHLLRRRVPKFTHATLTRWWDGAVSADSGAVENRDASAARALAHVLQWARLSLEACDGMELIARASEMARVYGIDLHSVLTRGSQYRVESVLLRLARARGFALPSPDKQQVAGQPALESLPLILEPTSQLFRSPVAVLDFRSLYPSIVIGYNLCYSTCLGPVGSIKAALSGASAAHRFGCFDLSARGFCTAEEAAAHPRAAAQLHTSLRRLRRGASILAGDDGGRGDGGGDGDGDGGDGDGDGGDGDGGLFVSANGMLFASASSRAGVLPKMLREILETRVMVKRARKGGLVT